MFIEAFTFPSFLTAEANVLCIQLKDLMDLLESQTLAPPQPERFLRSAKQKESLEPKAMGKSMTEETLVVDHEMEEEEEQVASKQDFFDPVNILDKLPKNFYDDLVCCFSITSLGKYSQRVNRRLPSGRKEKRHWIPF